VVSSKKLLTRGLFHLQGTNKGSPRFSSDKWHGSWHGQAIISKRCDSDLMLRFVEVL
jgi:hypothetical protein